MVVLLRPVFHSEISSVNIEILTLFFLVEKDEMSLMLNLFEKFWS